jgi:LysM repeat protein
MFCESRATVLEDLRKKEIIGSSNEILDPVAFETFNKEFTRFIQLKYPDLKIPENEYFFEEPYEVKTRFPYSSNFHRDDIRTTLYLQANDPLFNALDDERLRQDIKEEMNDYDILKVPDAEYPEDESLDPMFMRKTTNDSYLREKFDEKLRTSLIGFMEGLNIEVVEGLEEVIPLSRRNRTLKDGTRTKMEDPMAAFDMLQKYLGLRKDITDEALLMQSANVIFSMLGKKSKLGIELYKGIQSWSKYKEKYEMYSKQKSAIEEDVVTGYQEADYANPYGQSIADDAINEIIKETERLVLKGSFTNEKFNQFAHKQVIRDFIAEMLYVGLKTDYTGKKRDNPDISKDYFEKLGYRDKYEQNWLLRMLNLVWNWTLDNVFNKKVINIYKEKQLRDTMLDIVDDVYKKNYKKFIRSYYEDADGKFYSTKGEEFEEKFYEQSIEKDPFAKEILDKLFNAPYEYILSGSLVIRKYGRLVRAVSEDLHDIDGVIMLEQFRKEKNAEEFLKWIDERGLPLMKAQKRTTSLFETIYNDNLQRDNAETFKKEIMPFLEGQSWYRDLKKQFPSWTFENAFIGKDHRKGESITITGYIEHPTEMEEVEEVTSWGGNLTFKTTRPKRYVLDFFLRTREGNYPDYFDNYFLDWKQIFEAKINMGRGKDLTDLIYFVPIWKDKYQYTNKGFRYYTFAEDKYLRLPDKEEIKIDDATIDNLRAKEAAMALGQKIAAALKVDFMNITAEEAKQILSNRRKEYNGEPAFFFAGTVYIVGDNVNFDTVLHELAHPLLRAIFNEKPQLFENLYDNLLNTTEGKILKEHVMANYPELKVDSQLFKEEVLAYALGKRAADKATGRLESEGYKSFMSRMMQALKDILAKIFGGTRVKDIDVDTKIGKLADMLLDNTFKYNTANIKQSDVVSWVRDMKELADSLTQSLPADKIQESINDRYANDQLLYEKAKNFKTRSPMYQKMLKESLFIRNNSTELLPRVVRSLADYQTITNRKNMSVEEVINNTIDAERKRTLDLTNKSRSFVNSLAIIDNMAKNIYKDLDMLQKSKAYDSRDAVALLFLYRTAVRSWNDTFEAFDELLLAEENFDITQPNELVSFVNEIRNNLSRADKKIRDIYKENSVNFYVEVTGYMNDFLKEELFKNLKNAMGNRMSQDEIDEIYQLAITQKLTPAIAQDIYDNLDKKGIESNYVKKFIDEYNKFLINQDKITDGLSGKLKDVSWFNRFFESYTSSNDPIVGGLAIYLNDQRTEANNRALEKSYMFRRKLQGALEKVGYNPLKTTQLRDMLTFKDKVLYIDPETKEAKEREVYTYLNDFGNGWRHKLSLLEYNLEKAWASEDKDEITKAVNEYRQFKKDYMHDEYISEVYEKDTVFDKYGEVGKMAWLARKMALDAYNNEANEISDELERFQKYSTLQALWQDYQNLYSLKYPDMTDKVDDPANGIYDLSITKILLEYRDTTKDYFEFIPRTGSLQSAFNEFLSLQESNNVTGDELLEKKAEWIKQNIKTAYSQEFYDSRTKLVSDLKVLQEKINKVIGEQFDISEAYNEIFNLMYAYKDEQGQPVPDLLGVDKIKRIKELNQQILDYKSKFDTNTGLSKAEAEEFNLYVALIKKDPKSLTEEQKARYVDLLEKQSQSGLSVGEISQMQSIYAELSSLTQKVPTDYYVEALNEHLQRLETAVVTPQQIDDFINSAEFKALIVDDVKLAKWFEMNHVSKIVKDYKTKKNKRVYERTMVNSKSVPKNPDYYMKTTLMNEMTGKEETFDGIPNARHSVYRVKNKYRTGYNSQTGEVELEVGVHIDNRGQFLPRMYKMGDPNSAKNGDYINKDYQRLKAQPNSPVFQLLQLIKDAHLSFQEDKANNSKLYLDMPRYTLRDNLTRAQTGQIGKGIRQSLTDAFGKAKDENELEHNFNRDNALQDYRLVNTDLNGQEISYIPVSGMYNIPVESVDPDLISGTFKYLLSLEQQSQLIQNLPLVQSIIDTLEDPANAPKTPNTFSKTIQKVKGKLVYTNKPGASNNRAGQVRALFEREFYGQEFRGEGTSVYLDKFIGQLQKLSSRASLAINLPSDLKNRYGQIVQNMIEAAGGEFVTAKDMAKARLWAAQTMLEWASNSIYTKGIPALSSQMIEMFDSAFKFEDDFGRSVSRNFAKDMANGEWMYSVRKNLEMEATLQLFGAFLNAQKVEQKLSNGKSIMINYKDAWELNKDTGIAQLKPGVDPAWSNKTIYHDYVKGQSLQDIADMYGITVEELKARNKVVNAIEFEDGQEIIIAKAEKFKQFRNKFQGVSHRLYGAYDRFAQAEGNGYLPYRMFTFMRKWFIPMLTNRWGASVEIEDGKFWKPKFQKRYDWMTGKTTIGYYINAYLGMKELIKTKGKYWAYMDEQTKTDLMRTMSEALFIIAAALIASMAFGYDPDDKKRFAKMRERSGALGTDDFKTWGWMQNHMLLLVLGTQMETSAFVPLPTIAGVSLGYDDYIKIASTTTSSFGNTVSLYGKIFEDLGKLLVGNEKAFYSRKEGEYFWEQKDAPKIIGHLLKTVGITGSTGQVDKALENLEAAGKIK